MKKIIVSNYFSGTITIVSLSDKLVEEYDGDIESLLIENSEFYNASSCDWFDPSLDKFGNIQINEELINERKS